MLFIHHARQMIECMGEVEAHWEHVVSASLLGHHMQYAPQIYRSVAPHPCLLVDGSLSHHFPNRYSDAGEKNKYLRDKYAEHFNQFGIETIQRVTHQ